MYRFHPQWQRARQLVREGGIGELRTVQSFFSLLSRRPEQCPQHRRSGRWGLCWISAATRSRCRVLSSSAEPNRVFGTVEYDPRFKPPTASPPLSWTSGAAQRPLPAQRSWCRISESTSSAPLGRVEIEIPFNAPANQPCKIWYEHGDTTEEIQVAASNHYTLQGDAFSQAILNNTPVPTPLEDAVANMKVIAAVFQSGKSGTWV